MKLAFSAFLLSSLYSVDAASLRGDHRRGGRVLAEEVDAKFLIVSPPASRAMRPAVFEPTPQRVFSSSEGRYRLRQVQLC